MKDLRNDAPPLKQPGRKYDYKIAIIGSGIMAKVFAERAKELNMGSHCFSWDENDVACRWADHFHKVSVFDVEQIARICRENGVNAVLSTTELTILPAAEVAHRLGLIGNPLSTAQEITNKNLTREKVKCVDGLCQPKFWFYESGDIPPVDKYPVIVKPVTAGGKRGICVVNSRDEMIAAVEQASQFSRIKGTLIEEYLSGGIEYSVESLSYCGKHYVVQVTQKDSSGPPHCYELGHHQPAEITDEVRGKMERVISGMLTAVGIQYGPCHTEIKIIDGRIYLIEINGRPGGDHISYPLTELSTGYPFVSGIIWAALGVLDGREPVELEKNYSGICFITDETAYLEPLFQRCEDHPWLYRKNQISAGPSKITFNDEDNLNYFIYFSKTGKPELRE